MSVDFFLFRTRRPLGKRRSLGEADLLSFGSPDLVRSRLPASQVDLSTGEGADCRCIVAHRAAPWDLLPVVEALTDLGPFAIFDPQTGRWHAPEEFAASEARPAPALFREPKRPVRSGLLGALWAASSKERLISPSLLATDEGVVVSAAGRITFVDRAGRERWSVQPGRGGTARLAAHGLVYVGGEPSLSALRADDGRTAWSAPMSRRASASLIQLGDDALAAGTAEGEVLLLARDGTVRWAVRAPSPHSGGASRSRMAPAIMSLAAGEGYIVAGTNLGHAFCLTAEGDVVGSRYFPPVAVNPRTLQSCALQVTTIPGGRALLHILGSHTRVVSLPALADVDEGAGGTFAGGVLAVVGRTVLQWEAGVQEAGESEGVTMVRRGTTVRARDIDTLTVKYDWFVQGHRPVPPVALDSARHLCVFEGRNSETWRLALVSSGDGAVLAATDEQRRPWGAIGLAAQNGIAYVATDDTLTAYATS
jgi:hypothetical protein